MYSSIWYDSLTKPFLNPPMWLFSPVWIILYATLLVSLILYTIKYSRKNKLKGYLFFIVQLLLNLSWSPTFFVLHNIGLAFIILIFMDILALIMIINFYKVSKLSGIILIPYFLWLIFATYLNSQFLILN